ncbi:redoxin family protein [Mucilaginibacter sp. E4BP6]|uniref:TlpA disulfide reductase family protein n=1 Tax=Mucilaginibacter sp. E4BP6 TaxID=2723089 RepID=UPI0015C79189|nr:TlpA disulfide reductase family protein [Mucilaginibacter sp. E4BP6]NYE65814.1 peroxiredoxin [Mucilaginibacter sp. E4BP6]
MKTKILILLSILPLFAAAQAPNFTISGKIGNLNKPAMIYLDYENGTEDSTVLVNGTFHFEGHVSEITAARISLGHNGEGKHLSIYKGGDNIYPYFSNENIIITSKDSLINARVTGSKTFNEYAAYNKAIGGSIMEIDRIFNNEFNSGTLEQRKDTNFIKALDVKFRKAIADRTIKQIQFAKDHPDSFFGLVAIEESAGSKMNVAIVEPIYNAFTPELRATSLGKDIAQRINAAHAIGVGDPAPLFTLNNTNGKPISLADLKGKIVLIDFWASWCEPCRAESPNLKIQYKLYKDKGFEIISVSVDNDRKSWLKAISDDALPWIQVSDLKAFKSEAVRSYGIGGVPSFFLIDRDGKIIANTNLQGASLNKKLAEIFK